MPAPAFTFCANDGWLTGVAEVEAVREVPRERWAATTVAHIARPPAPERVVEPEQDAWNALMQMMEAGACS